MTPPSLPRSSSSFYLGDSSFDEPRYLWPLVRENLHHPTLPSGGGLAFVCAQTFYQSNLRVYSENCACGMAETTVIAKETCNRTSECFKRNTNLFLRLFFTPQSCRGVFLCAPRVGDTCEHGWGQGDEWLPSHRDAPRCFIHQHFRTKSSQRDRGEYLNQDGLRRLRWLFEQKA